MTRTLRYLQLGWVGTCVGGWLLVALTAPSEAECMATADAAGEWGFFCFTRKEALIVYGIEFAVFWFVGAFVTWGLYALVVWMQAVGMRARERRP